MATELSSFRQARIQHNVLSAMEDGLISREDASERLQARLGIDPEYAALIIDGDDDGFQRSLAA